MSRTDVFFAAINVVMVCICEELPKIRILGKIRTLARPNRPTNIRNNIKIKTKN